MNYEEFIVAVENAVRESLPTNRAVQTQHVTKNNGHKKVGITISQTGVNLSPTIYLEDYYKGYMEGDLIEEIVMQILDLYEKVRFETNWDTSNLTNYEHVKENIVYKLVHLEKNHKMLEDVPYEQFLDLAQVCYVLLEVKGCGTATILITNKLLGLWGVGKEDVFARARENTQNILPVQFYNMQCVIQKLSGETPNTIAGDGMYFLSNTRGNLGAAALLYEGVLEKIANYLDEDYYIIPSSVHEVIILPVSFMESREYLDELIQEVNAHHVETDEVLSDHAYYYDRRVGAVTM